MSELTVTMVNMDMFLGNKLSVFFHESGAPKGDLRYDLDMWHGFFAGKAPGIEFNELRMRNIPGMDEQYFETRFGYDCRDFPLLNAFMNSIIRIAPSNSGIKACSFTEFDLSWFELDTIGPFFSAEFCREWNKKSRVQCRIFKGSRIKWFIDELEAALLEFKKRMAYFDKFLPKDHYEYTVEDVEDTLRLTKEGLDEGYADYLIIDGSTGRDIVLIE